MDELSNTCAPEKLVLLAEELLRDRAKGEPTIDDVVWLLGSSVAWAHICAGGNPADKLGKGLAVDAASEAAIAFHRHFTAQSGA